MTTPKPTSTTTSTTTTEAPQDEPEDESGESADREQYTVQRAFTLDDGRTVMPGETFDPSKVEKWPARRSQQMVEQKCLRPITKTDRPKRR